MKWKQWLPSGDFSAGKAKGVGLTFRTSPDLSVTRVFTGLLLGGKAHCISTELSRGVTGAPQSRKPRFQQSSQARAELTQAAWPSAAQAEGTGAVPGRLEGHQSTWLSGNGQGCPSAWGLCVDRPRGSGRAILILLSKPHAVAGGLDRWRDVKAMRAGPGWGPAAVTSAQGSCQGLSLRAPLGGPWPSPLEGDASQSTECSRKQRRMYVNYRQDLATRGSDNFQGGMVGRKLERKPQHYWGKGIAG